MGGSAGPAVDEAFWDASLSRSRRTMPGAALPSLLAWLAVLLLGRARPADACSCSPIHPQQAFCNADVGERFVPAGPRPAPHSPPTWGSAAQTSRWGRRAESWRGAEGRTDGRTDGAAAPGSAEHRSTCTCAGPGGVSVCRRPGAVCARLSRPIAVPQGRARSAVPPLRRTAPGPAAARRVGAGRYVAARGADGPGGAERSGSAREAALCRRQRPGALSQQPARSSAGLGHLPSVPYFQAFPFPRPTLFGLDAAEREGLAAPGSGFLFR